MNMSNLIRKELLQMRWILIVGLIFGLALAVIIVVTFHYMEQVVAEIPPDLMELLARYEVTRELLFIFGDYSDYVWSQWNAKNLYQAGALLSIIMAASQFAGEVSRRTIGFYLSRPVTRREGFAAKVAAGMIMLLLVFGGAMILIWIVSAIIGLSAEWGRLWGAFIISLVWLSAYYLVGCIISILNKEPIAAGVITGVAAIFLSLPGLFTATRDFSLFYQMRAVDFFIYQQPVFTSLIYGLLVSGVLFGIGMKVFYEKDF